MSNPQNVGLASPDVEKKKKNKVMGLMKKLVGKDKDKSDKKDKSHKKDPSPGPARRPAQSVAVVNINSVMHNPQPFVHQPPRQNSNPNLPTSSGSQSPLSAESISSPPTSHKSVLSDVDSASSSAPSSAPISARRTEDDLNILDFQFDNPNSAANANPPNGFVVNDQPVISVSEPRIGASLLPNPQAGDMPSITVNDYHTSGTPSLIPRAGQPNGIPSLSVLEKPRLRISIIDREEGMSILSELDHSPSPPRMSDASVDSAMSDELSANGATSGSSEDPSPVSSQISSPTLQPLNAANGNSPSLKAPSRTLRAASSSQRHLKPEHLPRNRTSVFDVYDLQDAFKPQESEISIEFMLTSGQTIEVSTPGTQYISTIKDVIGNQARTQLGLELGMDKYLLKMPGAGFLTNENVPIKSLPYVQNCVKKNGKPQFILLERTSALARKIKTLNMEIGALIGRPLCWTQQDDEITSFRQSMTRVRYFERQKLQEDIAKKGFNTERPAVQVHLSDTPFKNPTAKVLLELRLDELSMKKTIAADEDATADSVLEEIFQKKLAKVIPGKTYKDFVMKATGLAEYIAGPYKVTDFTYIRECIKKGKKPDLSIVEAPSGGVGGAQTSKSELEHAVDNEEESFLISDPEIRYEHKEITIERGVENPSVLSSWDIMKTFRFRILGVENLNPHSANFIAAAGKQVSCDEANLHLYVTAGLYHGGELLDTLHATGTAFCCPNPRWYEWVKTNIKVRDLPRSTRICFTLWAGRKEGVISEKDQPLAWVNCHLFDYKHELRTGPVSLNMWHDDKANPIGTCVQSPETTSPVLFVQFDRFASTVVFPTERLQVDTYPAPSAITAQESQRLKFIANADPLYPMTPADKQLIWKYREQCKVWPRCLPKFLASVPKTDRNAVQESYRLLDAWAPMAPLDALELLDSKFPDKRIREYAVVRLEELTNEEISDYLLELVQVLKYEPYHDSALARFLLQHALRHRHLGHLFFWLLKSEIHVGEISERYGLLMEAYLRGCGSHLQELKTQDEMQKKFIHTANMIKNYKDSERLPILRTELTKLNANFPAKLALPLNPRLEVNGLNVDKCKYMDSKKLPLWLVFKNADTKGADPYVIFKSGDDLRQDMLTLQMIRIMDKLWKREGYDLQMSPYGCLATGCDVGMIEVVLNAQTTAAITKADGGVTAAFKETPLAKWLQTNNASKPDHREALQRFIKSCAGYSVATYVLGIGDRHNDNIMVTKDGRLFHIDFGHFLGNYKKKFGIKRERAPFVFTPDFAYVMGGKDAPDFMTYVNLCCTAYNILRKNASIFINLFAMMLSTGIPELRSGEDIEYLREAFSLDANEEEAKVIFTKLIYESLACKTTQINNAVHIAAH